jgi:hypothetical protein
MKYADVKFGENPDVIDEDDSGAAEISSPNDTNKS